MTESIQDHINRLCEAYGVLPAQIAKELGVSPSQVFRWRTGQTQPNASIVGAALKQLETRLKRGSVEQPRPSEPAADRVKAFRDRHNLTQSQLAKLLKVKLNTVAKWEQGLNKASGDSLDRLDKLGEKLEKTAQGNANTV